MYVLQGQYDVTASMSSIWPWNSFKIGGNTQKQEEKLQRSECFQTMNNSLDLWAFDILAECSYYAVFVCKQGVEKQLAA